MRSAPLELLAPGTLFANDFRILRELRKGGMGAVYVAEQLSTAQLRALKVMRPELVLNPKLRARFAQEARVGARIASEHVVSVLAAGIDEATGAPWLAMELLLGEDLAELVAKEGPLAPPVALPILEQVCHAVSAAHAAGVVHRDLKPENIFVAKARRLGAQSMVKVLDFGIAKIVADRAEEADGDQETQETEQDAKGVRGPTRGDTPRTPGVTAAAGSPRVDGAGADAG
jgi:serine/threonine protein kinase